MNERLRRFSSGSFQFITEENKKLQAKLKIFEPRLRKDRPNHFAGAINPVTMRPVTGPPEDKRVLSVELIYPFESKAAKLDRVPPLDEGGAPAASIGVITYHKEVPVVD